MVIMLPMPLLFANIYASGEWYILDCVYEEREGKSQSRIARFGRRT